MEKEAAMLAKLSSWQDMESTYLSHRVSLQDLSEEMEQFLTGNVNVEVETIFGLLAELVADLSQKI